MSAKTLMPGEAALAVDPPAAWRRSSRSPSTTGRSGPSGRAREGADIRTYLMAERSARIDFEIRSESARAPVLTPHRHEFFQIFANLAGHAPHLIAGRRLECAPRSLVFVLPYRVHLAPIAPGQRYQIINFASNFLRSDFRLSSLEMEEASLAQYPELAPFLYEGDIDFRFEEEEFAYLCTLLERLQALQQRRTLGTTERIRGTLLELIGLATEKYATQLESLAERRVLLQRHTDALKRVLKFIDEHLSRDISLNDVAEAAFLSPSYLSQLLKKETGLAFVQWLTARRMDRARELLVHSGERISSIAHAVGFPDEAYFTRRFRQRFDTSPSAYRLAAQAGDAATPRTGPSRAQAATRP
jgi:AraC-like DNA-binding protein